MKPVDVIENESERDQEHYEGEGDGHWLVVTIVDC